MKPSTRRTDNVLGYSAVFLGITSLALMTYGYLTGYKYRAPHVPGESLLTYTLFQGVLVDINNENPEIAKIADTMNQAGVVQSIKGYPDGGLVTKIAFTNPKLCYSSLNPSGEGMPIVLGGNTPFNIAEEDNNYFFQIGLGNLKSGYIKILFSTFINEQWHVSFLSGEFSTIEGITEFYNARINNQKNINFTSRNTLKDLVKNLNPRVGNETNPLDYPLVLTVITSSQDPRSIKDDRYKTNQHCGQIVETINKEGNYVKSMIDHPGCKNFHATQTANSP